METCCFTSVINNYLPKARILARTLKQFHPDWHFILVVSEPLHESIRPDEEPFDRIVTIQDLDIQGLPAWIFKHTIMEICTAVKGPAARYILKTTQAEKLIFLDPDIAVFDSLQEISDLLDTYPIILTPHQTKPESNNLDVLYNEVCFLKHGVYNLGFFAVRNKGQGKTFIDWYCDRLTHFCYIDFDWGLYTDQRWCDLAPVLFDQLYILRDPGYNVARWNLSQRTLTQNKKGMYLIDGKPLRFFHFSGYDSGQGMMEIKRYVEEDHVLHTLWDWYDQQLLTDGQESLGNVPWRYSFFSSGNRVGPEMNRLYRQRTDLQKAFPDPFHNNGTLNCFENWYAHEYPVNPGSNPANTRFGELRKSFKAFLYQLYLSFLKKKKS
jgi:hypothetical protein